MLPAELVQVPVETQHWSVVLPQLVLHIWVALAGIPGARPQTRRPTNPTRTKTLLIVLLL
jgi:hypothetical protein